MRSLVRSLYSLQTIITVMRPRRMRWVQHVVRVMEITDLYRILVEKIDEYFLNLGAESSLLLYQFTTRTF
jgi:hypothetical protein